MNNIANDKSLETYQILELGKQAFNKREYNLALKYFNLCKRDKEFYESSMFEIIKIYFELCQDRKIILNSNKCIKNFKDQNLKNNVKIILAKQYKILKKEDKSLRILDSIEDPSIRNTEYFIWERLDTSYLIFSKHFRASEFSGDIKKLKSEFCKIKDLPPQNKSQLFYIIRISNYFHHYDLTKQLVDKYRERFDGVDEFYDNAILNEYEIAMGTVFLKSKPKSMWIATSSKCNVYCKMCDAHKIDWKLSPDNIGDIYNHMPYLENITWWGGEPTISDLFYEMLEYSLQYKNIKHVVITNGQYMPQRFLDIVSKNNIEVVISIDSVDKEMYETLRKGASFDRLRENLSKLSKVLKSDLMKVNMVAMKNNVTQIKRFVDFIKEYNIKRLVFIPLSGNNFVEEKIKNDDIELLNKQKSDIGGVEIFNTTQIIEKKIEKEVKLCGFCHCPWTDVTFTYSGSLIPDNLCGFFGNKVCHINSYKDIDSYWNSRELQELRRKILQNRCCSSTCPKANIKLK